MRVFIVTGATGFLGKSFVDWLLLNGERVIVIVRDKYNAIDIWGNKVKIIERDLADIGSKLEMKLMRKYLFILLGKEQVEIKEH